MKIVALCGLLGYGYAPESLKNALAAELDFVGVDGGSTDPGPYYLGSGKGFVKRLQVKRDLALVLPETKKRNIPLIIGSAGGSGAKAHVDSVLEIISEIAKEQSLEFKTAVIYSDLTSDFMKKCNIQSVVFGKRLKINGQPVRNGILYIDGVLYIDQSSRLMMRNIFRQLYITNTENFPEYMKAHIFAETFADLLWNSYRAYKRAKTDNDFYEKVKIIIDLNILRPHAYRTMNLNRIIECR